MGMSSEAIMPITGSSVVEACWAHPGIIPMMHIISKNHAIVFLILTPHHQKCRPCACFSTASPMGEKDLMLTSGTYGTAGDVLFFKTFLDQAAGDDGFKIQHPFARLIPTGRILTP
jgi:hypothetical protein